LEHQLTQVNLKNEYLTAFCFLCLRIVVHFWH